MKNILLLLLISISCFGQLDITKRQVTVDSLKARTDSIYIESPASYNGYEVATVKDAAASGIGTSLDGEILYNNAGTVGGSPITISGIDKVNVSDSLTVTGVTNLGGILFTGSTKTAGAFYTGTDIPTGTDRLNIDAYLYSTRLIGYGAINAIAVSGTGSGATGVGLYANTNSAIAIKGELTGSLTTTLSTVFDITNSLTLSGNITAGALIKITDNPTLGVYTSSHKVLSATIGSTERISLNPRATTTTFGYLFDTHSTIDSIFTIRNNGNRIMTISDSTAIFNQDLIVNGHTKLGSDINDSTYITGNLTVDGDFKNIPPHASFYRNTDTTISATQNVWYKLRMTTTKDIVGFTKQKDTIQFTKAGSYVIDFTISFSGVNNEVWEIAIFKNNIMEEPSQLRYTSTADVGNMSCPVYVTSDGNDWFAFKIRNTTDNDDPTLKRVSIIITTQHLD